MSARPAVLFVCVKNSGKSQMAAGLMRRAARGEVEVYSAGTAPGDSLNELSVQSLLELGVDIRDETPKPIDPRLLRAVDLVVTLGREAHIDPVDGVRILNWDTDEPSERGIDGIDRMRLIRDDIDTRVRQLLTELRPAAPYGSLTRPAVDGGNRRRRATRPPAPRSDRSG